MSWLSRVFALVLQGRGSQGTAQPIQPAGPALPERMTKTGNKPFAQTTYHQRQPVPQVQKRRLDRVDLTRLGVRSGSARALALAQMQSIQAGSKNQAPANPHHQRAHQSPKQDKTFAHQTKTGAKSSPAKIPVLTRMVNKFRGSGS